MSTIKVNTITTRTGCTMTLGESGKTVSLASGASQSGFGRTGTVDWDTTPKTADLTGENGKGYFIDTSSGTITLTLPASPSAGNIIALKDYGNTFNTNNLTVNRNGSKIDGATENAICATDKMALTLVYVDSTQGWKVVQDSVDTFKSIFVEATGGTTTTCGDFKIHTFTSPGTFCVQSAGTPAGSNTVEYLVVAGGGSGGSRSPGNTNGGGGAGGFRFASPTIAPLTYPAKPLAAPASLTLSSAGAISVTVGAGASAPGPSPSGVCGQTGSDSIFSTITSSGGGGGGSGNSSQAGLPGGSGGGGGGGSPGGNPGGNGNTPPVSPPQGNNGGTAGPTTPDSFAAGGGGATAVGGNSNPSSNPTAASGGAGAGLPTAFGANGVPCGSFRYYAGGGGAGSFPTQTEEGPGGLGGGGAGGDAGNGTAGTANSGGGGGGGSGEPGSHAGGAGGSGIVVIRYKFQ